MKFTWNKSQRSIEVTELPSRVAGLVSADELTVSVNYADGPSCRKGITLDNAVMPLMAAAPELLAALQDAEKTLRWAAQRSAGRVAAEVVGGWLYHADNARAAIAKAEARDDT